MHPKNKCDKMYIVKENSNKNLTILLTLALVVLIGLVAFSWYQYTALGKEYDSTKSSLEVRIASLEENIYTLQFEKTSLNDALEAEQQKNNDFEEQIKDLAGTIGTLDKLSKIDPELLKKYSKVFFLSEHYIPTRISRISQDYLLIEDDEEYIHSSVQPFLKRLMERAKRDDIDLKILSGYRSFDKQSTIKNQYKVIYGAGTANQFSAEQGYSEHQLGTAVDFTSPTSGAGLTNFDQTPEFEWLEKNAHKYGFTLSYPQGNAYYVYEPWHWRFVGEELATKLYRDNKHFYDLDQRDIDKYLVNIFD
jgi:D-alanyl-D-alanine carboxypeptidase